MTNKITYYRINNEIEYVYYENATESYPLHTHARHMTLGCVLFGKILIVQEKEARIYSAGEYFCIPPDSPHAIETVDNGPYSMLVVCIGAEKTGEKSNDLLSLKQKIAENPESLFKIEDMAQSIGISPYHMIREFKKNCGLTPHQFQIQCRVRKAQKLLAEKTSVVEAAYAAGFYDQSHFDRCFHKIVRLTPNEYKKVVKYLP